MADLSNQQINQSYPGLLTLQDATQGIQPYLQNLQDGLGGNTGLFIATNRLDGGNLFNYYRPGQAKYYGCGLASSTFVPAAGSQNQLISNMFYDNGLNSYSAFTINCGTLEAGSSVDISFYNSQYLENYGYVPYEQLSLEVNISTTSTGLKTGVFSSPLSFLATGAGVYWVVYKLNTPSTPVLRLGTSTSNVASSIIGLLGANNGYVFNTAGTACQNSFQANTTSSLQAGATYNTTTFPSTWTSTELNTITSVQVGVLGFVLHTIR